MRTGLSPTPKMTKLRNKYPEEIVSSSEAQGQLVGAGKSLQTGEKNFGRGKVKNDFSSPEFFFHPF